MIKINGLSSDAPSILAQQLINIIPISQKLCILATGTDRWTGDCLGPLSGSGIAELNISNIRIVGTLRNPLQPELLEQEIAKALEYGEKILVIDSALGKEEELYSLIVSTDSPHLGATLKKKIKIKPDATILGVVNRAGFMEQAVLQNTRLFYVSELSKAIVKAFKIMYEAQILISDS